MPAISKQISYITQTEQINADATYLIAESRLKGGQTSGSAWLLGGVDLTIYEVYELKQDFSRATAAKSLRTKNFMNKAKLLLELQALKFYTYSCIKLSPFTPSHLENLCT